MSELVAVEDVDQGEITGGDDEPAAGTAVGELVLELACR
jgi:hypothetical protein